MMFPKEGRIEAWLQLGHCPAFGPSAQRWMRQRPWFIALVVGMNISVLDLAGLSRPRLLTLLGLVAMPLGFAILSLVHPRLRRLTPTGLWFWMAGGSLTITSALAATGGLRSPLLPMLVVPVITIVGVWGWALPARILAGNFACSVLILSALPPFITGAPVPSPYYELLIALNLLAGVSFGCRTVLGLSEGFTKKSLVLDSVRAKALEAATGRVRSLEQVGAKVAHDERSQRRLEDMTREVARMEGILLDYLSFSRPLEDLRLSAVDLANVADNVVALLEGRAAERGVRIERTGGSLMLAGDGPRLEEALLNLTANALEATPSGGTVRVDVFRAAEGGTICVRDTGVGMDAAVLEKVGTPFFTTRREGTGLGVVLARAVITQHGGRLEFTSRPGQGTTATVTLPPCLPTAGAILPGHVHGPSAAG